MLSWSISDSIREDRPYMGAVWGPSCLPSHPGSISSAFKPHIFTLYYLLGSFLFFFLISCLSVFSRRALTWLATKAGGIWGCLNLVWVQDMVGENAVLQSTPRCSATCTTLVDWCCRFDSAWLFAFCHLLLHFRCVMFHTRDGHLYITVSNRWHCAVVQGCRA